MINVKISKKVFNDKYLPYLDNEDRYLLFYGGLKHEQKSKNGA